MLTDDLEVKVIDFGNSEIFSIFNENEMNCNYSNYKYFFDKINNHIKDDFQILELLFEQFVKYKFLFFLE